jgi:hypothetical protein
LRRKDESREKDYAPLLKPFFIKKGKVFWSRMLNNKGVLQNQTFFVIKATFK